MSERETQSDGGITRENIFGSGGETERSRTPPAERFRRLLDIYLIAPAKIGWSDWRTRIGGIGVAFYLLMGTVGVWLVPAPRINEGPRYLGPFQDWSMPFGTTQIGRGVFKQVVHSTPGMLMMALAGIVFAVGVAVIVGMVAGYKGGVLDTVLMTITDIVITIPGLPLIVVLSAIFAPKEPFIVGAIVAIDRWPGLARQLRSQVLTLRSEDFVESARAMGLSTPTIVGQELTPKLAPYILINAAGTATVVIMTSVALYFIGVLPFNTLNWGVMMNFAYEQGNAVSNLGHAHWLFFPLIALAGLNFSLVLFSQGLDRVFNPRLRARHSGTVPTDEEEGDDTGMF